MKGVFTMKKGLAILAVLISAVSAVVFFRKRSHC